MPVTVASATIRRVAGACAAGLLLAIAPGLRADALLMDAVAAARASAPDRPTRGMTMGTVERRWGEPASRAAAVGTPPITRWEYPGFVVVFEYQHVVHAIARTP
jgi:hypothetical protein